MRLHLGYRLWISELNFDINVLRIFDDYLKELALKKEPELKTGIDHFEQQFLQFRNEIDELRHEMHLQKMKLGADAKKITQPDLKTFQPEGHKEIELRYAKFRKAFNTLKKEFSDFEGKWLD